MATAEEVTDLLLEEMKIFATEQQQYLYEILSDYTIYESNEHKYLKQNIGYAIYGPPKTKDTSAEKNDCCSKETENLNDANDATDIADYDDKEKEIIDKIYDQICKSTIETHDSQSIYFSTIYNMIIRPKTDMKPKEEKKESKAEIKEAKNGEKQQFIVTPVPIFKIGKSVQKKNVKTTNSAKQENALTAVEILCETLKYIDLSGRAYKTWADYKENNNLPQCTMVLPKDGFYQPDPSYPITEDYSTVWLEIMDSPACTWTAKLCNGMDIASSVVGICSLGFSVASMFTPLALVGIASAVAGAGAGAGVSDGQLAWTIRSPQQLIDRSNHEESIYLFDNEAFPHYLGIAGTAFGLGAVGGTAIISKAAARGMTVNIFARGVFNTIQGGNLFLNGVGVAYQGGNMINKYRTEETISVVDALNLATHLMFFCSSVVKIEFANDIIKNTQGRVINDYRENLSSKRLRKKFNRVKNKAAVNNTSKIFENAEVIRYIKHRQELLPNQPVINSGNQVLDNTSRNIAWSFEDGTLMINDIKLLDPREYVISLISLNIFINDQTNSTESPQNGANDANADQLLKVLYDLLSKFYTSDDCPKSKKLPIVPDFERLIREMSSMRIDEDCLKMLFKITEKLMKHSKNMEDFLIQTFTFVWQYCKANLKQWGISLSYCTQSVSGSNILQKIIKAVFEAIDMILNNLFDAFETYMDSNMNINREYKF